MASTYLKRTAGTSTENYKYTFSAWVKRTGVLGASSANEVLFSNWTNSSNSAYIRFEDINDNLHVYDQYGSGPDLNYKTNMKFRDPNAWYHIVVNVDGTRSANQRCKIYVNGSEVSCSSTTDTGGTLAMKTVTTANNMIVGAMARTPSPTHEYFFSGLMSHVYYIDGTGYDASYFGETDATTGEWKIKTSVSVTYGNNGFSILQDGNTITDQSSNSNDFTLGAGTLTNTEDCPSDVFCTLNPLQKPYVGQGDDRYYGNTTIQGSHADWQRVYGTIGVKKGKFYYEWKCSKVTSHNNRIGWDSIDNINLGADNYYSGLTVAGNGELRGGINGYSGYDPNAVQMTAAYSGGNFGFVTGDILGMALDRDNNTISIYKNGNLEVNAYSFAGASNCSILLSKGYFVAPSQNFQSPVGSNDQKGQFNFGNGYFEGTAITSEGTNASGIGKFEYDVPSGYTAWSTKGLNA